MKRAVVTGASGMIGSALIRRLVQEKVEVAAVVRPGSKKLGQIPQSPLVAVLECPLDRLDNLPDLAKGDFDGFYHFAWDGTFGEGRNDAYLQNNNVRWTLDAVHAAYRMGCAVFVGAGSQAEYGRVEGKLSPGLPVSPETGYGIAKYTAGKLSAIYAAQLGISHVWARILIVYGPGDNAFTMVSSTIQKLLQKEKPSLTKGEQLWDYLYCDDAAEAFYRMGRRGQSGVYCVGSGVARPLREYMEQLRDAVDPALPLGIGERPYGENQVMCLCADIDALTADTGFVPKVPFSEGIARTVTWMKNRPAGAEPGGKDRDAKHEKNQYSGALL